MAWISSTLLFDVGFGALKRYVALFPVHQKVGVEKLALMLGWLLGSWTEVSAFPKGNTQLMLELIAVSVCARAERVICSVVIHALCSLFTAPSLPWTRPRCVRRGCP